MDQCYILLKEVFPKDMFVDPYQIQQLPDLQKQVFLTEVVDLEKPAQEAHPQIMYIFMDALDTSKNKSNSVTIPFHLRYQKPHDGDQKGNYVDVYLSNLTVFGRCKDADMLTRREFLENEVFKDCPNEIVKELCSPHNKQECHWIKFKEIQSSLLHFQVPRGNLNDLGIVTAVTSLVICMGFAYLVRAIHGQRHYDEKKSKLKSS